MRSSRWSADPTLSTPRSRAASSWPRASSEVPVRAGDVLLELDANLERLARNETEARLKPAAAQLASLTEQLHAEQRALQDDRRGAEAALAASRGQAEQAAAAAQLAADEARRTAVLHERGLVSEVEAVRAQKAAEQRRALADSAEASVQAAARDRQTGEQDRVARIASVNAAIAALEGTRDETVATSERLGYEISRRQIRAPIGGTLAEVAPLRAGSVVHPGDRILTILPAGDLQGRRAVRPRRSARTRPGGTGRAGALQGIFLDPVPAARPRTSPPSRAKCATGRFAPSSAWMTPGRRPFPCSTGFRLKWTSRLNG